MCGRVCAAPASAIAECTRGECTLRCEANRMVCSERCVDTQNDAQNCGRCAQACAAGQRCMAGTCQAPPTGEGGLNIPELRKLLDRIGVSIEEVAERLGVSVADLGSLDLSLDDLRRIGVNDELLEELGITLDDLARIGVDVGGGAGGNGNGGQGGNRGKGNGNGNAKGKGEGNDK